MCVGGGGESGMWGGRKKGGGMWVGEQWSGGSPFPPPFFFFFFFQPSSYFPFDPSWAKSRVHSRRLNKSSSIHPSKSSALFPFSKYLHVHIIKFHGERKGKRENGSGYGDSRFSLTRVRRPIPLPRFLGLGWEVHASLGTGNYTWRFQSPTPLSAEVLFWLSLLEKEERENRKGIPFPFLQMDSHRQLGYGNKRIKEDERMGVSGVLLTRRKESRENLVRTLQKVAHHPNPKLSPHPMLERVKIWVDQTESNGDGMGRFHSFLVSTQSSSHHFISVKFPHSLGSNSFLLLPQTDGSKEPGEFLRITQIRPSTYDI